MRKLRILQVSSAESLGGGERHVIDLAKALMDRGHQLHFAVRRSSPFREMLAGTDAHFHELALRNASDVFSAAKIALLIHKENIGTVHGHVARDYPVCGLAARMAPVDLFLTRHHYRPFVRSRLYDWTIAPARNLIAVSESVAETLRNAFPARADRIVVIPNWVDSSVVGGDSREVSRERLGIKRRVAVAVVGQLTPLKRQDLFIRAADKLISEGFDDVDFVIVGGSENSEADYIEELTRLVRDSSLGERIIWTGYVPDFSKQLSAIDLLVAPSENEGFSLVVAEAMAAGVGVIATRAGGLAELVQDGRTGVLVPVDDLDALCDAMRSLLTDDELRRRLGGAARAEVRDRFDREKIIDRIEQLYLVS